MNQSPAAAAATRLIDDENDDEQWRSVRGGGVRSRSGRSLKQTRTSNGYQVSTGVHWSKSEKKWVARIRLNGDRIRLGSAWTKKDAARAYDEAALEFHGEFAVLNNVSDDDEEDFRIKTMMGVDPSSSSFRPSRRPLSSSVAFISMLLRLPDPPLPPPLPPLPPPPPPPRGPPLVVIRLADPPSNEIVVSLSSSRVVAPSVKVPGDVVITFIEYGKHVPYGKLFRTPPMTLYDILKKRPLGPPLDAQYLLEGKHIDKFQSITRDIMIVAIPKGHPVVPSPIKVFFVSNIAYTAFAWTPTTIDDILTHCLPPSLRHRKLRCTFPGRDLLLSDSIVSDIMIKIDEEEEEATSSVDEEVL